MAKLKMFLYRLFIRRFILKFLVVFFLLGISSFICNQWIVQDTADQIFENLENIPPKKVALVLGTSKGYSNGAVNLYFKYRIEAAAKLYHNGKVKHILVSGDNHTQNYNEPEDMRDALMDLGVPKESITLDYAGFRTFDSMVRAKEIFGADDFIVVSQKYHLQRALFIANSLGIKAVGYAAQAVRYKGVNAREYLAKFKAVLDCYVLPTSPKFLGEKEFIY